LQPVLDFFGRKIVKQVEDTAVKKEGKLIFLYFVVEFLCVYKLWEQF